MKAIEFQARVENGAIPIPDEHKEKLTGSVHVLVMIEDRPVEKSIIKELLANPLKIRDFQPFSRDEAHERT